MDGWIKTLRNALDDQLWVRPATSSLLSLAVVALAAFFDDSQWLEELSFEMGEDTLAGLFSIFASSMLTVATFSVAAIVTAISAVSSTTTPRAERLVLADSTAQNVLASFVTAFIYSVIGLLALEAFAFGPSGRFILFVALVGIVAWVLISFLGWVSHVTSLGRVSSTIARIEGYALTSAQQQHSGGLGARLYDGEVPTGQPALVVRSSQVGFVTIIGLQQIEHEVQELSTSAYLAVRPGDFVRYGSVLATLAPYGGGVDGHEATEKRIASAFTIDKARESTFDLRFGLLMLTETADRALSPGVNDPMTAVAILRSQLRVLTDWVREHRCGAGEEDGDVDNLRAPHVYLPRIKAKGLVADVFAPIARDGAGQFEVAEGLQEAMAAIVDLGDQDLAQAAIDMAQKGAAYADEALVLSEEAAAIRDMAERLAARGVAVSHQSEGDRCEDANGTDNVVAGEAAEGLSSSG